MSELPPRSQEKILIDHAASLPGERLLCNSAGRGQFAALWAQRHPAGSAACFFLDQHLRDEAAAANPGVPNLALLCQSDPPAQSFDAVAWCVSQQGDAELTRELLQTAHERLATGGMLLAATDNPRDQWLHDELRKLFAKVTRQPLEMGVLYRATKLAVLKKLKHFACEFAFRDGECLIHLRTRPGVFSHRELDGGARALIEAMQIRPNERVLDLGCGSGAIGVAAGLRAENSYVVALDSNPRAVESAHWAAERNGLRSFEARLNADGSAVEAGEYDVVLANPPYYSNFRLAEHFAKTAARALRLDGRLLVVTKQPQWYLDRLPELGFALPQAIPSRAYWVIEAVRSQAG
jgi:16S rRNA (guanine1207-N2)-methyltransferase